MAKPTPAFRPRPRLRPAGPLAVLAALAAALLLSACGGSSSPAASAAAEQASERESETKLADFARCLREHGVQAETANGPGGGRGLKIGGGDNSASGPAKMEAAQNACKKYRPQPKKLNLSPQEKVQREEAVQKFARCMREHGIDVHASATGGAIQIGIHGSPGSGPNPESPAFQTAQNDCQGYMSKIAGGKFAGKLGRLPRTGKGGTEGSQSSSATLSIRSAGG